MKPTQSLPTRRFEFARRSLAAFLLGGALLTLGGSLGAQTTYTYTGGDSASPNLLNDAANYSPTAPTNGPTSTTAGASDIITFNSSGYGGGTTALVLTNSLANFGGTTGGSAGVLFNFESTQTASVAIGGPTTGSNASATIRLAGVTVASGAGAVTFNANGGYNIGGTTAATTNTLTNNSASTLTFSSSLNAGGAGQRTLDFAGTGTGNTSISGPIGNSAANIVVQKDSSALLLLSGANAYNGATNLNAGVTRISNATALGSTGSGNTASGTVVASGATLQLTGNITVGAEALTISGAGAAAFGSNSAGAGALENNSGTNSYGGAVTLAANSTIASDGGTTLNLTSTTAVAGNGFTLTLVGSGTGTITGGVATGAGGLTKTGAGTWTLNGTSTYTGATTVSGGTLLVGNTTTTGSTGTSAVAVSGAGTVFGGTGTVGGVVTINNGAILQGGVSGTPTGTLTLTSTPVLNTGSVIGLTLGTGNAHSTIALSTNGFNGFQTNQVFTLTGLQAGNYDNIITGVAANIDTTGWTVTNGSGFSYKFTGDGTNIDLVVTAVPEPSTWAVSVLGLALGAGGVWRRRRQQTC